jgi:hypothetical protein
MLLAPYHGLGHEYGRGRGHGSTYAHNVLVETHFQGSKKVEAGVGRLRDHLRRYRAWVVGKSQATTTVQNKYAHIA